MYIYEVYLNDNYFRKATCHILKIAKFPSLITLFDKDVLEIVLMIRWNWFFLIFLFSFTVQITLEKRIRLKEEFEYGKEDRFTSSNSHKLFIPINTDCDQALTNPAEKNT